MCAAPYAWRTSDPSSRLAGYSPSRIVPPMSRSPATTSSWSAMVAITGCGVLGSNSAELAPSRPARSRATSITMHCRPRHRPSVEMRIPTLGLCLGLQCMVIEVARDLAGLDDANSAEFDPSTPHPVISTMADQLDVVAGERDMGGTMRLGLYPADLRDASVARAAYGLARIDERHRHRYEVNNAYREPLESAGLVFSGLSPDGRLVEFAELPQQTHPFFVGTQAHPEF